MSRDDVGDDPGGRTARVRPRVIAGLSLLYTAQGVPFGFAAEYLPVVLRQAHYSLGAIAALGWLQLPWQAKVLWAHAADGPLGQARGRPALLVLQLGLAAGVALFALAPLDEAPRLWFALTFACALLAATQDVFVDALAVRTLREVERGPGNTAQVAGYRLGILVGGAGLLMTTGRFGERPGVLLCAALVALASVGAFALRPAPNHSAPGEPGAPPVEAAPPANPLPVGDLVRRLVAPSAWRVLALALTYKLGLHMAGTLIKPMAVDAGWSREQIGLVIVTVGTTMGLLGAAVGGLLHARLGEATALGVAGVVQALVCLPLAWADHTGVPLVATSVAIAVEHFASGAGTTVLFAALMSATRRADAGRHYTVLTSANALCIGLGSMAGGLLADAVGKRAVFVLAAVVCLAPLALLSRWSAARQASAR